MSRDTLRHLLHLLIDDECSLKEILQDDCPSRFSEIRWHEKAADMIEAASKDPSGIFVMNYPGLLKSASELEKLSILSKNVIILSNDDIHRIIGLLHQHKALSHICNFSGRFNVYQFLLTLEKTACNSKWAFSRYLSEPREIYHIDVDSFDGKYAFLSDISSCAARAGGFSGLSDAVTTIASELLMNAVFNAPYDEILKKPRYADSPRNGKINLDPREKVELNYGYDGNAFVISVVDRFGRLTRENVVDNLYRCLQGGENQIKRETKGAGAGFFMIANTASQLDIHIDPLKRCEVAALIHLSKRQINYDLGHTSFNFFKIG
ncbi:MAG: hypothetical protein HQK54_16145 [Oligoflexales bacterium]|nr:hypothetical protein [Oligoflexales bacterium]